MKASFSLVTNWPQLSTQAVEQELRLNDGMFLFTFYLFWGSSDFDQLQILTGREHEQTVFRSLFLNLLNSFEFVQLKNNI